MSIRKISFNLRCQDCSHKVGYKNSFIQSDKSTMFTRVSAAALL